MQYYVSLNDQEFPLALIESSSGARRHAQGAAGPLEIEVLSQSVHGRPALVLVDGVVCRVLVASSGRSAGGQRAQINGHAVALPFCQMNTPSILRTGSTTSATWPGSLKKCSWMKRSRSDRKMPKSGCV